MLEGLGDVLVVGFFFLLIRCSQDRWKVTFSFFFSYNLSIMLSKQNTYVILCKTLMYIYQKIEENGKRQWIPPLKNVTCPVYLINTLSKIHKMQLVCLLWNLKKLSFLWILCQMLIDSFVLTRQSAHIEQVLWRKRKFASSVNIISHTHLCKMLLFSEDE